MNRFRKIDHAIAKVRFCTNKLMPTLFNRDIFNRNFSLAEFLSEYRQDLTPAGLCFFQAAWDKSVTQTFIEILGKTI